MKKSLFFALVIALVAVGFGACKKQTTYSPEDLIGRWQAPSGDTLMYMVFQPDMAPTPSEVTGEFRYGYEWDMNDHEGWDDSQGTYEDYLMLPIDQNGDYHGNGWFAWKLESNGDLIKVNYMHNGGADIPKTYKVTVLTNTSLSYKDDFGTTHQFTKQ